MRSGDREEDKTSTEKKLKQRLVKVQHTIKQKFKKAFKDRIRKERQLNKTFKPITHRLDQLQKQQKQIQKREARRRGQNERVHDIPIPDFEEDDDDSSDNYSTDSTNHHIYDDIGEDGVPDMHNEHNPDMVVNDNDDDSQNDSEIEVANNDVGDEDTDVDDDYEDYEERGEVPVPAPATVRRAPKRRGSIRENGRKTRRIAAISSPTTTTTNARRYLTRSAVRRGPLRRPPPVADMSIFGIPGFKRYLDPGKETGVLKRKRISVRKKVDKVQALKDRRKRRSNLQVNLNPFENCSAAAAGSVAKMEEDVKVEEKDINIQPRYFMKKTAPRLRRSQRLSERAAALATPVRTASTAKPSTGRRSRAKRGAGIETGFIPYDGRERIVYEYFDDPNELCDRLHLLVASQAAGNSNHSREINSIVEELRELGFVE